MLKVVVVGNGMVGHHYVEQLVASETEAQVTVIGGETAPPMTGFTCRKSSPGGLRKTSHSPPEITTRKLVSMPTSVMQ